MARCAEILYDPSLLVLQEILFDKVSIASNFYSDD